MQDYSDQYAKYYDLLTRHKNYVAEVAVLVDFLRGRGYSAASKLLSVGCGTGSHERLLANHFSTVVGIDQSSHMIEQGRRSGKPENLELLHVDVDGLAHPNVDIVISLFNVVNCIGSAAELERLFRGISRNLVPRGLVMFEIWNPVAITAIPPQVVEREYAEGDMYLRRKAHPTLDAEAGWLKLEYDVSGRDGASIVAFKSVHEIYLHSPATIDDCLARAGFGMSEWYSALSEGMNSYNGNDRMLLCVATK